MHRHAHWTFVWEDGFHDVTPAGNPNFQSSGDPVSAPKTFPVTFTEAGTYTFFCSVHGTATSGMHGTITVR
jgi:plastocyanin